METLQWKLSHFLGGSHQQSTIACGLERTEIPTYLCIETYLCIDHEIIPFAATSTLLQKSHFNSLWNKGSLTRSEPKPDPHRNHTMGVTLSGTVKDPLPWRDQIVRMTTLLLILSARAREAMLLHTGLLVVSTESQNTCYHVIKSWCRQGCWQPLETCSVTIQGGCKGTSVGRNPPVSVRASQKDLRVVSMTQRTVIRPFPHLLFSLLATQKENQIAFL